MKRFTILFSLLFVAAFSIMAQSGASISFEQETHDFGTIEEGPKATHEFRFTNTGNDPLVLSNVKASCGCTVPTWPKEPVMPGESAVITATYNTQGRPGNFNKAITINSNAIEPTKIIYIKGKVEKAKEDETMPVKKPGMLTPSPGGM